MDQNRFVVERGSMDDLDQETIQMYAVDIEKELDAKDITTLLFSRFIIDTHDLNYIEIGTTRTERTRRCLSVLPNRGFKAFNGFLDCLEAAGYITLAAKLRGEDLSRPSTHDKMRNWEHGQYITEKVNMLDSRIVRLEEGTVINEKLDVLTTKVDDVIVDVNTIKHILKRVEELTRASTEAANTIKDLKNELKEKEKLLVEARRKIEDLENKVEDLEKINVTLKRELKQQREDIDNLNFRMDKDKKAAEKKRGEFEAKHERQMKELKDEVMKQVSRKKQPRPVSRRASPRRQVEMKGISGSKIEPIEPKNRFQPDRKYNK